VFKAVVSGLVLSVSLVQLAHAAAVTTPPPATTLQQVDSADALNWVHAENDRTFQTLQSDSRYQGFYDQMLSALQSKDRLVEPTRMGSQIWNFWQDAQHPRGIWRSTSEASFISKLPGWTTRLDIDALAAREHANWVFKGAECLRPQQRFCMVSLSDAGEDATTEREFDAQAGQFVTHGFSLGRSKQTLAWVDRDTVLISRDWGGNTMTRSGYPFVVREWKRGTPLSEAHDVMRGDSGDVSVDPMTLDDGQGHHLVLIHRGVSFFDERYLRLDPDGLHPIDLPRKLQLWGLLQGRLILSINEDFKADDGRIFTAGSLLSIDPAAPRHMPQLLFTPNSHQAVNEVGVSRGAVLVTLLDNVRGRALVMQPTDAGHWDSKTVNLPDMATLALADVSSGSDRIYLTVEGYTMPPQLWRIDTATGNATLVHAQPDLFDASGMVVDQNWATSRDGTRIPYFIVHAKNWQMSGRNPTLMTAYGGFQLSYTPTYTPEIGRLWLSRGGVYVVANIRGGGEFGPAWHEAGRKSGRQHVYDDFAAVGRDLVARHITTPQHLGIRGRSNGGLLMGVEFTQHPELWNAVIIGVALLDMLHFETMAAGASWADEYGSVSVPQERDFLASISPLQHLTAAAQYPEPFIFTSTRDDRVGPVHARLFAARLQSFGKPFLYYEDTEGGHAGTVNAPEVARERAMETVYLSRRLMDHH